MLAYIVCRLLLVIHNLLGILLINFIIVQAAPGGPVEQMLAELKGQGGSVVGRISGESQGETRAPQQRSESGGAAGGEASRYRGARGMDPAALFRSLKPRKRQS